MFHLLRAGLVAAGREFCAVVLVTIAIHLIPSSGLVQWSSDNSAAERFWASVHHSHMLISSNRHGVGLHKR